MGARPVHSGIIADFAFLRRSSGLSARRCWVFELAGRPFIYYLDCGPGALRSRSAHDRPPARTPRPGPMMTACRPLSIFVSTSITGASACLLPTRMPLTSVARCSGSRADQATTRGFCRIHGRTGAPQSSATAREHFAAQQRHRRSFSAGVDPAYDCRLVSASFGGSVSATVAGQFEFAGAAGHPRCGPTRPIEYHRILAPPRRPCAPRMRARVCAISPAIPLQASARGPFDRGLRPGMP